MSFKKKLSDIFNGFASSFWIANSLELFERLAFYGAKAVLVVFLASKVGLDKDAGTLTGLFSGVIFSLPIVAGVFVDKYGFRKTLMACFTFFCIGYFLIGMAGLEFSQGIVEVIGKKNYVIIVLLLTAIGGSLIKPCIVGTVAKTTNENNRAFGFSIYYSLVNLGGAIGPIIALTIRKDLGIEYVLMMSSFTSFLLFIGTWLFFKEPVSQQPSDAAPSSFSKVFQDMLLVFSNIKFISFLIIFSGFWIMFWQIYYLLPFYATKILHFEEFEILETVDAWCIIVFSLVITALVKKWKPFTAMIVGLTIASFSWIIIGLSPTVNATIIGVALFAIGESTQAPRFYEYVSLLAPKNQTGTFMGFAFLPIAIGSFAAGAVSDWLRNAYIDSNPAQMWFVLAGIGFISILLLVLYNFIAIRNTPTND